MPSLVTDSRLWTYLCGFMTRMNTIVRSVITCRQDVRVADPEQGVINTEPQQKTVQRLPASDPCSSMFSKTKMHDLFRSLLRMKKYNTSDVDVEKAVGISELTQQEGTNNLTPNEALPVSPSLSISSILDMMPIPVTTPQERALAASILASRNASPTWSATPPLTSPSTPGVSFFTESAASPMLNTPPPPMHESMIHSPEPTVCSTLFLEPHPRFAGVPPCDLSVSLSMSSIFDPSEESGIYEHHQGRRERWAGSAGFTFPVDCNNRLFPVVEEEEYEDSMSASDSSHSRDDEVSDPSLGNGFVVSESPWDNGELEGYGLKGKASWVHKMKSFDSADDQFYAWIRVED